MDDLIELSSADQPRISLDMKQGAYPVTVHEWMKAIRAPTPYRLGNARFQLRPRLIAYLTLFTCAFFILIIYILMPKERKLTDCLKLYNPSSQFYNSTYPLTNPERVTGGTRYKIGLVTDLDMKSKSKEKNYVWMSYFKSGYLTISDNFKTIDIVLDDTKVLVSGFSQGGRGMELSELIVFNGKLYTVDDRTGIVYQINGRKVIPWVFLSDGNGQQSKGLKAEWMAIKNQQLYVGGLGKEWISNSGEIENLNPQWISVVGIPGDVQHINWQEKYNALRSAVGIEYPGYIIHEAGVWSEIHKKWFFLPRRVSREKYDEKADESRASNLIITCHEDFSKIEVKHVGIKHPTHGFSSFKFVPNTHDKVIVALKSEEDGEKLASYILVFTIDGEILYDETPVGRHKYEGIEFI